MPEHYITREINWRNAVAFHSDIARRMEQSFFEVPLGPTHSERWSPLTRFLPSDASGAWEIREGTYDPTSIQKWLTTPGDTELFVGGPCWVGARNEQGAWRQYWRPMLYRSIRLEAMDEGGYRMVPERGAWDVSPILAGILEGKEQIATERPLAEMVPDWLEKAFATPAAGDRRNVIQRLKGAVIADIPELQQYLNRNVNNAQQFAQAPTPWILFSAPQVGAMTRHLVGDYKRLGELLAAPDADIGGLRLFEGYRETSGTASSPLSPVITLNESQEAAVKNILAERPITVISGPPGCGKSQVVLSLLLNAWERGTSVLFSSNNNQAVNVVRDRLAEFEEDFPVIVRSGSQPHSTLLSTLMDTVNYVTGRTAETPARINELKDRLQKLYQQAEGLKSFLASNLPDRVDQTLRSALKAYGTYQETVAEHARLQSEVEAEFADLGIKVSPGKFEEKVLRPVEEWLARLPHYEHLIAGDQAERTRVECEIRQLADERDRALREAGLSVEGLGPEQLLVNEAAPEAMGNWLLRYQELLAQPLDKQLEPFSWDEGYDRWKNESTATEWAESVRGLIDTLRRECADMEDPYLAIEEARARYEEQQAVIEGLGLDAMIAIPDEVLAAWSAGFAGETTLTPGKMDWLPWSDRSRARRAMRKAEKIFRPSIALSVWQTIGRLDGAGRAKLAEVVAHIRKWIQVRTAWGGLAGKRGELEVTVATLRTAVRDAAQRTDAPKTGNPAEWQRLVRELEERVAFADAAAIALGRREIARCARAAILAVLDAFRAGALASPIRDIWIAEVAGEFEASITRLESDVSSDSVRHARSVLAVTRVAHFVELWATARDLQIRIERLTQELGGILPVKGRCAGWRGELPASLAGKVTLPADALPAADHDLFNLVERIRACHAKWHEFVESVEPALKQKQKQELRWAKEKLREAMGLLPEGKDRDAAHRLVEETLDSDEVWPSTKLQRAFERFNPARIKANLESAQAQIKATAFSVAKAAWLTRVTADRSIQDGMDDLHTHYSANHERLQPQAYPLFKRSLPALPLWVTTAMSPQSIPMEAGIFDILVIDEATQCTLTSILPLIFRAKRLVVIGDSDQLPAIPNIGRGAEAALSARYELSDATLQLLAHNDNDLYRAAARCMPGGRSRVRLLNEHYRSHPLIIGFSNQHVYQKKLRLRTKPVSRDALPFGSAVHGRNVVGSCSRGQYGSSWLNEPEAEEVKRVLAEISGVPDLAAMSIGVVTPFRAQEKLIEEKIKGLDIESNVQIGTAHAFQGDERDIMIFSPVVAAGMLAGAARWVEEPRNLINVAVTRARQGLFVVADFNQCRGQRGILGSLIKYVETVEILRKTSHEELDLFSWMTVQGWNPQIQVHQKTQGMEVDFILSNQGRTLAIEVDGKQHEETTAADEARDATLVGQGHEVLRVPAREIREMHTQVIQAIAERLGLPVE